MVLKSYLGYPSPTNTAESC